MFSYDERARKTVKVDSQTKRQLPQSYVCEKVKTITFLDAIKGNVLMISFLKTGRAEVLNILFYSGKKGSPNLTRSDTLSFIQEVSLTMP